MGAGGPCEVGAVVAGPGAGAEGLTVAWVARCVTCGTEAAVFELPVVLAAGTLGVPVLGVSAGVVSVVVVPAEPDEEPWPDELVDLEPECDRSATATLRTRTGLGSGCSRSCVRQKTTHKSQPQLVQPSFESRNRRLVGSDLLTAWARRPAGEENCELGHSGQTKSGRNGRIVACFLEGGARSGRVMGSGGELSPK